MIAAAPPTASVPAQAPNTDVQAPPGAAPAAPGHAGRTGRTGAGPHDATADATNTEAPAGGPGGDTSFSRLLEPETTTGDGPVAPASAAVAEEPSPSADALPDQLLELFAVLVPPTATVIAPARTAGGAQADGTAPQRALAAAMLPAGAPAPAAQAKVAGNGTQDSATTPAPVADVRRQAAPALPLPAVAANADDGASAAGETFSRLLDGAAAAARDGLPAEAPAPPPPTLSLQPSGPAAASRVAVLPQAPMPQPADPRSGYGDDFGNGVLWMAEKSLGHAQLRVSPDHLGPIDVRLQLDGVRVHAEFSSAQADVRQALEASLPRLRELLGQHGLELAQADVGQHRQDSRPHPNAEREADGRAPSSAEGAPALPQRRAIRGLLDEYA